MGYRFNPTPSHYMLVDHLSIQSPGCLPLKPLCYVQLCSIISNFVVHCTVVLCILHWIDERMLLDKLALARVTVTRCVYQYRTITSHIGECPSDKYQLSYTGRFAHSRSCRFESWKQVRVTKPESLMTDVDNDTDKWTSYSMMTWEWGGIGDA